MRDLGFRDLGFRAWRPRVLRDVWVSGFGLLRFKAEGSTRAFWL